MAFVIFVLMLTLKSGYGQQQHEPLTKHISCSRTMMDGGIYDITCTDFCGNENKKIDSCALLYYGTVREQWGWNYAVNPCNNWLHPIELLRPTKISCTLMFKSTDELVENVQNQHDNVKGSVHHTCIFKFRSICVAFLPLFEFQPDQAGELGN